MNPKKLMCEDILQVVSNYFFFFPVLITKPFVFFAPYDKIHVFFFSLFEKYPAHEQDFCLMIKVNP